MGFDDRLEMTVDGVKRNIPYDVKTLARAATMKWIEEIATEDHLRTSTISTSGIRAHYKTVVAAILEDRKQRAEEILNTSKKEKGK